ncbi:nucleolar complex protein 2-like protein [Pyrus ussuriensis x Pyrus communis]|uniref:Nucleolar complex protein 2-like protein n=1 Tax=Pyrus ussuriensis x Pyrus communis TaxID=2448454 RepID=A0A5N5G1B8_9ROSA|nr:nucleolar complex protein 2-like protein [Pyrus ussuriensis x Pyrus communis]
MDLANPSTAPPQAAAASHPVHLADPPHSFHRMSPPRPMVHVDNDAVQEGLQPLDVEILSHLGADGRIHSLHRSRPDEWYECPICHEVYESAQVFSAHTGVHYRALSTAANVIRLHRKHNKELQNNKLQLLKFDDGSVALVPANPTSTEVKKKKINLLDGRDDALGGESDHRNETDLVVDKKKRSRALGVGGIGAPQSGRGRDDNVKSSPVVAPQEHSGCP